MRQDAVTFRDGVEHGRRPRIPPPPSFDLLTHCAAARGHNTGAAIRGSRARSKLFGITAASPRTYIRLGRVCRRANRISSDLFSCTSCGEGGDTVSRATPSAVPGRCLPQGEVDRRACARRTFSANPASMLRDDPTDRCQA